ncbi:unnamed protein product, partial [Cuscuta epithymum]
MTKPFGSWLRASGRKAKQTLDSKWLLAEGSSFGGDKHWSSMVRPGQEVVSDEMGESPKAGGGNGLFSGELEEEGLTGELKRRRTWKNQASEDAEKDDMALDFPKKKRGWGGRGSPTPPEDLMLITTFLAEELFYCSYFVLFIFHVLDVVFALTVLRFSNENNL